MEAKLNETQELELEIEKLKGTTNVMKHMVGSDEDEDIVEKMAKTQIELEARETALQDKMMTLAQKERVTNDEYQDARKAMIQVQNLLNLSVPTLWLVLLTCGITLMSSYGMRMKKR